MIWETVIQPFADFGFMRRALLGCITISLGATPIGVFLMLKRRGWRSCVVYTNEVNSEIWRTNDAMSSLRSSGLDSLWHQSGCPTLPLPSLPTDLSNTTTRQRSSPQTTGLSALSGRDGNASDRPSSWDPSQDGLSLVGPSCRSTPGKPTSN